MIAHLLQTLGSGDHDMKTNRLLLVLSGEYTRIQKKSLPEAGRQGYCLATVTVRLIQVNSID